MALPDSYVQNYGQIPDFFGKLQQGQAPAFFTQQHLKDLGFASSNFRAYIPLMKAIGFLTPDGKPTPRYHEYRNKARAKAVMADALREAYSDIFVISSQPKNADKPLIEGKFKSAHNASDRVAQLMSNTFLGLLGLADLSQQTEMGSAAETHTGTEQTAEGSLPPTKDLERPLPRPSLHYTIQIHLPATKDIEVFNAIFRSLREHLY